MPQISVTNAAIIQKLKSDAAFQDQFLGHTKTLLDHTGFVVDKATLATALKNQLGSHGVPGNVASTVAIITVF